MKKICPIRDAGTEKKNIECIGNECAWWVSVPTVESGYFDEGCALAILAKGASWCKKN
jgi:hypothetical protein